jgi:hypothetical protein
MKALHDNNFWVVNPELSLLKTFDEFRTKDKSKDKSESSKIMWAIYYAYHPESKFFVLPNKLLTLAQDFLKDPKFNWDKQSKVIDTYCSLVLSDAERALVNWNEIMVMRDTSIKELYKKAIASGDTDELVKIDRMLANTPKMFEDYKKIKRDYEDEKTTKKGKNIKSLTESGEI